MGCDIHLHIEYRPAGSKEWHALFQELSSRHYGLFARLAGVRRTKAGPVAIAPPRGIPSDVSVRAGTSYYYVIRENAKRDGSTTPAEAEYWVQNGLSEYHPTIKALVSGPDFHNPSWLTACEFCQAVREVASSDVYWSAVAAAVLRVSVNNECRVVFWFDN